MTALLGAARRALDVLEWLTENHPDCFGWAPPYPSTTPCIQQEADALRAALASPSDTAGDDAEGLTSGDGPFEARYVAGGAPADCVNYGVVSLAKGKEVCRVWEAGDARLIADLLNRAATPAIRQDEPEGAGVPIPDGWALVPVEPTEAMQRAFVDLALHGDVLSHGGWTGYARDQWSAMLAASPRPAATDQAGEVERG